MTESREPKNMTAPEYIRANFHPSDRIAAMVRNRVGGSITQRIATAEKIAAPSFQEWLRYKNEKESCDVYIGMNALKQGAHSRTKEDVLAIRHLYLDLDHDAANSLARIEQSEMVPLPSYVLQTSPNKFQVTWKVDEMGQDQAEQLQRAMVREFGADPAATDSTRVLRLPGFTNRKHEQPFIVRIHSATGLTHTAHDFKLRLDPSETGPIRAIRPQERNTQGPRQQSQSERDWAYAKRALTRGLDPEEIIRNIAEFRAYDKHNPQDYARRTVTKAQAELQQTPPNQTGHDATRGL